MTTRTNRNGTEAAAIAQAIRDCFISPNETDSNFEPCNIVDALCKIARAGYAIRDAIEKVAEAIVVAGVASGGKGKP
jgi:hypothetical protein